MSEEKCGTCDCESYVCGNEKTEIPTYNYNVRYNGKALPKHLPFNELVKVMEMINELDRMGVNIQILNEGKH